jgi:tetratricopeptide (TPR) repeat protein
LNVSLSAAVDGQRPPLDEQNPWPGLDSFRESEQRFFRGRSHEVRELFALIERAQISVLYGVSGIGKSSLLQAGLFPVLREKGYLPIRIRFDFSGGNPDLIRQVKHAVETQCREASVEAPTPGDLESLWEYFHHRDQSFWDSRNRLLTPVLIFDQFEEIFTLGSPRGALSPAAQELMRQVADLAEGDPPNELREWLTDHPQDATKFVFRRHFYRVVISLRDDFLGYLDDFRHMMPSIAAHRERLLAMDGVAALRVAAQAPEILAPEVAERVVRFVAADENSDRELPELLVDPALLSVMCSELNEKRKVRGERSITADLLKGSRDEILRDFYHRAVNDVHPAMRRFLEERLIIDPGYRDTVALDLAPDVPGARDDIDQLIHRRLIRAEQRGPVRRVELTHDLLVPVIRESRDQRRIGEKAEQERTARLQAERALRKTRLLVAAFAIISLVAIAALVAALIAERHATYNKQLAEDALENLSGVAGNHSVEVSDEAPETLAFRQQLLTTAKSIYERFRQSDLNGEDLRRSRAMEHFSAGDLYRLSARPNDAIREYQNAISELRRLVKDYPSIAQYAQNLAGAYLWLGETERPLSDHSNDAKSAYDHAAAVALDLTRRYPAETRYHEMLAEAYDDRGILEQSTGAGSAASEDFRTAIRTLVPLTSETAQRDLANAKDNLALFLVKTGGDSAEAARLFNEAIQIGETLRNAKPTNRDYKLYLAEFNNNSAQLLGANDPRVAKQRNQQAIDLLSELTQPNPYLNARLGLYFSTRAYISDNPGDFKQAVQLLKSALNYVDDRSFHIWLGQALTNLAESGGVSDTVNLLQQAIDQQRAAGSNYDLAWDYYYLAMAYRKANSTSQMQTAVSQCQSLLGTLQTADQAQLRELIGALR